MVSRKCNKCSKEAKITLSYGPHQFCKEHFLEFFEKRVRKTNHKNQLIKSGEKVVVGYSGGKDSTTALYLLKKIYPTGIKLEALMLDEGIPGYRDKALKIAKQNCKDWKIPFTVLSFEKEFGISMQEIMKKTGEKKLLGSTCSFCGPMRRMLLEKGAKQLKADKLVTGHNLDDETQSIAMNFFDNDFQRMNRLGVKGGSKKFVPRIKPLYECPEKEIIAFVNFANLKHSSNDCCPFSWQAKRNDFRKMLDELENKYPGTKYSILKSFQQIKPFLDKSIKQKAFQECKTCGNPSSESQCMVCKQLKILKEK